jgi:epoxyqueuosine reductase QueG
MGNSGDQKFLSQLEKLSGDSDEVVSESAAWAIRKLRDPID